MNVVQMPQKFVVQQVGQEQQLLGRLLSQVHCWIIRLCGIIMY